MTRIIAAAFVFLIVLPMFKAYLCTVVFKWNDRKKNNTKHTIQSKILAKSGSGSTTELKENRVVEFLKSYSFSYVTIYGYFISWIPSQTLRKMVYKEVLGCAIGKQSCIHFGVRMLMPHRISIGENCIIGESCFFDGRMFLEIRNNINFSTGVTIWTMQHDPYSASFGVVGGTVTVDDNAWLSFRSTILPSVAIAKNCVIGAHSLVTKSTNESGIYFGLPAKEVSKRNVAIDYKLVPMGFFY